MGGAHDSNPLAGVPPSNSSEGWLHSFLSAWGREVQNQQLALAEAGARGSERHGRSSTHRERSSVSPRANSHAGLRRQAWRCGAPKSAAQPAPCALLARCDGSEHHRLLAAVGDLLGDLGVEEVSGKWSVVSSK